MSNPKLSSNPRLLEQQSHEDSSRLIFWLFLGLHVVVWTAICLITQPNMPLDMMEMIYWGQQWQMGYHKHPPLPAWTASTMWEFGQHHPWALYLTSQLTIAVTYWAVWQLARDVLSPKLALCSVLVMEGCYYCTYMTNDINNTIMTRPMWALAILFLYRALSHASHRKRLVYWCLAGAAIGLGMLCKYYMAVLVLAMLTIPIVIPATRQSLRTSGPYVMTGIALLIFLPHFLWMVENDFITVRYIFDRSDQASAQAITSGVATGLKHITSPLSFIVSQLGAVVPVVVLLWPLLAKTKSAIGSSSIKKLFPGMSASENFKSNVDSQLFQKYLIVSVCGPVCIYLVLATLTGASIRSMWGGPLFSFLGLLLIVVFGARFDASVCRTVLRNSLIAGILMAVGLFVRNGFGPAIRGELSKVHFPGLQVSKEVNRRWNAAHTSPLPVAGGDMFVSACVGIYSDHAVDVFGDLNAEANPWVTDQRLSTEGGMLVWDIDELGLTAPSSWLQRFPTSEILPPLSVKTRALTGDATANVGVIIVHPNKSSVARKRSDSPTSY